MRQRVSALLQRKFVQDTLTLQIGKVGVLVLSLAASVIVPVLLGPASYGTWQLVITLYGIWKFFNLTGLIPSAQTRFAVAVGAQDLAELLNIMGLFVRGALLYCTASTLLLWLARPLIANTIYDGDYAVVNLAVWLSLTQFTELVFNLFIITFSSRRQMRHVAALQNVNQLVLVVTAIGAVLIARTPTALVISRIVYSLLTLAAVLVVYQRTRAHAQVSYPGLGAVLRAVPTAHGGDYWRFGVTNALDKNVAGLFTLVPVQLVGALHGDAAAGYIGLALNGINQQTFFTSAILDNMQAVVPQAVGRGDYARLWQNFSRVLLVLAVGGGVFYVAFALLAPLVVPVLYTEAWVPAVPLLQAFALFGAVTTVGSVFGPLYRAFDFVRGALLVKLAALAVGAPLGVWLVVQYGALGGVWMINALFVVSVGLTAWLTLPELRSRARTA